MARDMNFTLGGGAVAYWRLLQAAKEALRVLDEMSLDDLMEGKDARIRAELVAAIREIGEAEGI